MQRPQPRMGTEQNVVGKRVLAFLIDIVLISVVLGVVFGVFAAVLGGLFGRAGGAVVALVSPLLGLVGLAYFIYMEGTYGQTLGKRFMDVVVVTDTGAPCDMKASAIRNILRIVDALPTLYIVGFAVMYLVSDDRQRVGDIVADTVVVRTT